MHRKKVFFPKSIALSNMSWNAGALRLPFTGSKPSQTPKKQPHTIIPRPPNFTVDTVQLGIQCSSGICQTQTRPSGKINSTPSVAWHCM